MQLLKDIVTLLSDKDGSLTDALLKTKVLMHRIGHKELAGWVNDELNGYLSSSAVPDYRTIPIRLYGNVSNIVWRHSGTPLPISHLPRDVRERFCVEKLRQSAQVLEQLSKSNGSLSKLVTPEWYHMLAKGAIERSFSIDRAWVQFEPTQIVSVLIEIRSRLLDFALNLQGELGDVADDNVTEAAKGIDAAGMFASAVFGDNTTVVIGSSNETTITNTVTKGDFTALANAFKAMGVSETDLAELQVAVENDDPNDVAETMQFGPKVKAWMGKMSVKAIDGAWGIGIGAAGNLLADALGRYYGIK
ncbi:AbiTii domain-containing protein [Burkholderia multivorans]